MSNAYSEDFESLVREIVEKTENDRREREEQRLAKMNEAEREHDRLMPDAISEVCRHICEKRFGPYHLIHDENDKFYNDVCGFLAYSLHEFETRRNIDMKDIDGLCDYLCNFYGRDWLEELAPDYFFHDGCFDGRRRYEFNAYLAYTARDVLLMITSQWASIKAAALRLVKLWLSRGHIFNLGGESLCALRL